MLATLYVNSKKYIAIYISDTGDERSEFQWAWIAKYIY